MGRGRTPLPCGTIWSHSVSTRRRQPLPGLRFPSLHGGKKSAPGQGTPGKGGNPLGRKHSELLPGQGGRSLWSLAEVAGLTGCRGADRTPGRRLKRERRSAAGATGDIQAGPVPAAAMSVLGEYERHCDSSFRTLGASREWRGLGARGQRRVRCSEPAALTGGAGGAATSPSVCWAAAPSGRPRCTAAPGSQPALPASSSLSPASSSLSDRVPQGCLSWGPHRLY